MASIEPLVVFQGVDQWFVEGKSVSKEGQSVLTYESRDAHVDPMDRSYLS